MCVKITANTLISSFFCHKILQDYIMRLKPKCKFHGIFNLEGSEKILTINGKKVH